MRFQRLVEVFEQIEATTKRLEMTDLLVGLIKDTPKDEIGRVVYLTQGKLYPDYMGVELGIAEKLAIRAIANTSGKKESDVLEDYKRSGDLGLTAERVLKRRTQATLARKALTVADVYGTFDRIAHATGGGSVEARIKGLERLLADAQPTEAKYIARMALGKLRLGIADMTILDALAVAYGGAKETRVILERAYNLSSDLGYVASTIAESGLKAMEKFQIQLGRPIRPMLSERATTAQEILERLNGRAAAEYKYDGLRIQAHVSPKEIHLFSRRLENITAQFPDVVALLRKGVTARRAVIEAECVAVDPNTGEMLPFQMISQRRGRKFEIERMSEEIPVTLFPFDAIYSDGKDLTLQPYPKRRKVLEEIIREIDHVRLAEQKIINDAVKLDVYLLEAVANGCEGLVVKSLGEGSVYQAGARGWLWIKYKRSYKAEVADTFDLVPVGAFAGRGKRAGTYGALLMAVYNDREDVFETICKLGSGFTDKDLAEIPATLKSSILPHRHSRVTSKMEPDVWFTPSVVMEVAADEITLSPLHTCGWNEIRSQSGLALRFPRFTGKWRTDKSPEQATSSQEAIEMYRKQLKQIEA
jgi:DNA ligase-1